MSVPRNVTPTIMAHYLASRALDKVVTVLVRLASWTARLSAICAVRGAMMLAARAERIEGDK